MITGGYQTIKAVPEQAERRIHVMSPDNVRLCDIVGTDGTLMVEFKRPREKAVSIPAGEILDLLMKMTGKSE